MKPTASEMRSSRNTLGDALPRCRPTRGKKAKAGGAIRDQGKPPPFLPIMQASMQFREVVFAGNHARMLKNSTLLNEADKDFLRALGFI
jgi:hypothetical protein